MDKTIQQDSHLWIKIKVQSILGEPRVATRRGTVQYNYNCPFCSSSGRSPDTSYNLEVNYTKYDGRGAWQCWRCPEDAGSHGSIRKLLGRLGLVYIEPVPSIGDLEEEIYDLYDPEFDFKWVDPVELQEPPNRGKLQPYTRPYYYLRNDRNLTERDIDYWGVLEGDNDDLYKIYMRGRVIFPYVDRDGRLMLWSARSFTGNHRSKYFTSPGMNKSGVIFNLDRAIDDYGWVILTEGVLSAAVAGPNSVCALGKHITPLQCELIIKQRPRRVVVSLDGDATVEAMKVSRYFHSRGIETYMTKMPYREDPASLGRDTYQEVLKNTKPFDPFTSLLDEL